MPRAYGFESLHPHKNLMYSNLTTMKKTLNPGQIAEYSSAEKYEFPKYTTLLLNLICRTAGANKPRVVGQMSDLIQEFDGQTLSEWISWYNEKKPTAVDDATALIMEMLGKMRTAFESIDETMVRNWVKDLLYTKTYCGLRYQEAIISYVAQTAEKEWRLASKEEEAAGIDGYVGSLPVQIKPVTYRQEGILGEHFDVPVIYYEETSSGVRIEYDEEIFK